MTEIKVKQIPNGKVLENCYVVSNLNNDAIIIDPGSDEENIIFFIKNNNLTVRAIINTHAHYDHIGGISKLKDEFSIPLFLHSKDEKLLKTANLYVSLFQDTGPVKIPTIDYYIDKIDIQDFVNSFSINILYTPGHTHGGVCILIEDCLFTGDTLLNGNIGRVDLPGGNIIALKKSLELISKLPVETIIYPGHGSPSTIGRELIDNEKFIKMLQ